jgi:hypothetical protein
LLWGLRTLILFKVSEYKDSFFLSHSDFMLSITGKMATPLSKLVTNNLEMAPGIDFFNIILQRIRHQNQNKI